VGVNRQLKAVVFDMDGLMLDTERISLRAWTAAEEETGVRMPDGLFRAIIGKTLSACQRALEAALPAGTDVARFVEIANRHYHDMIERGAIPTKAGLPELLKWLDEQGVPLAVATSTERVLAEKKLGRAGIRGRFDVLVGGDEIAHSKPAPDIYLEALRRLGVGATDAIALEDSPNGLRAARAAGLPVILVPDLAHIDEPTRAEAAVVCADLHGAHAWLASTAEFIR